MSFHPYIDEVSVEGVKDGYIQLGFRGSQSYDAGEYTNERNRMMIVKVSPETAEEIVSDIDAALDKIDEMAE